MAERNNSSKSARSVLFEDFNDLDIYVEDTALESKKLYKEVLKRVFKDKYKIEEIFPIGNSQSVIRECELYQEVESQRKKVFIIDGDFYLLNGNIKDDITLEFRENIKGLFILPRYCIENYFIDKASIIAITHDEEPEKDIDEITINIAFDEWISKNEMKLLELFVIYSIVIEQEVGVPTIKHKVSELCIDNSGNVCENKIDERIDFLKTKILEKNIDIDLEHEIELRLEIVEKCEDKLLRFVSGKDYLMPLLKTRIQSKNKFSPNNVSLKNRLAKSCNVEELKSIEDFIF